ncbi:ImmA/IrrE family metallo-endopeptidase [Parvibaculum sp.]|uniref:ImmA/IrrE family metallo-endopeptidase n=1 Tax=Parvibaculum sp. TaxID=2024848 RepID=UPI0027374742|nr:ImmA/IrrE family metallo-endopeptidase [Parvibaculum sp.]MDP3328957.1 ImmA/IrrE family metallo-endopeptidase [Parvibaculum sp.]
MNDRLRPAERILQELGIECPQDIDLEAIAWTLGAAVKYRPLDKCEAMIVGGERRALITVNSKAIPTRRRFSIAHEIGHWHHHRGRILFCGAHDIGNPADDALNPEKQADQFASDLILPSFMVQPRMIKMKRPTLAAVREIADEFDVSDTATLLKIIDLDHFPILAVCHNKERRRWFRRAPMIPGWWFPRQELDHESFAFEMLFGDANESAFPRKIGADAWFEFRGVDRFEIQEQSFRLPNDELLTLLVLPDEALE